MELFVSGRLCLFGEHSDWAGEHSDVTGHVGCTIVVGTGTLGLHATVERTQDPVLHMTCTDITGESQSVQLPLQPESLLATAQQGGFWSYVAGTAYVLVQQFDLPSGQGLRIHQHTSTLPMSKGLSSSAAVCVLVARAFSRTFGLRLSRRGEMEVAYQGETTTPSRCGRMDQAVAFDGAPVQMKFDGRLLHVHALKLAGTLHIVLVDLGGAKDTTTILQALQSAYPVPMNAAHTALHDLLGPLNLRVTEQAVDALASGDMPALGKLMCTAQSMFDAHAVPMCPAQLTAPLLHRLLSHTSLQPLVWGGKGVGSQGDGTAQLLCKDAAAQLEVCRVVREELGMTAVPLTITPIFSQHV